MRHTKGLRFASLPSILLALALAVPGVRATFADPIFRVPSFEIGREPNFILSADFNGDGRADLAVVDRDPREQCVAILLGRDQSLFGPPVCYPVGRSPVGLAVGDFDNDHHPDLAVAESDSSDVAVLLGNGDGTFRAGARLAAQSPISVAAGDFNGDGRADLAVVSGEYFGSPPSVAVYAGAGDGTFSTAVAIPSGDGPVRVASGDFDRDGRSDLALTDVATDEVRVFVGNADGSMTLRSVLRGGLDPEAIAIADLDADGALDLAVTDVSSADVSVYLGRGNGSFRPPAQLLVGDDPVGIAFGDFNQDGRPDLAVSHRYLVETSILLGDGAGGFRAAPPIHDATLAAVAGEFSGDGVQDLAAITRQGVSLFRGRGEGTFEQEARLDSGQAFLSVVTGDFNGDGWRDIAVSTGFQGAVHLFLGRGDGSFAGPGLYPSGVAAALLVVGDFSGDRRDDLAALQAGAGWILVSHPDGSFAAPAGPFDVGMNPFSATTGDFNGDGRMDLAVGNGGMFGDPRGYASILLGNGDGTFAPRVQFPAGDWPQSIALGDFNADGRQDLVVSNESTISLFAPGSVSVLLGDGGGAFGAPLRFAVGVRPRKLAVGDLNGDGILDLAVPNSQAFANDPGDVSVLIGRGDGTFDPEMRLTGGFSPSVAAIGDFNVDGRADLVVVNGYSGDVSVFFGGRLGGFEPQETYATGLSPYAMAVDDFNADGRPDLVLGDRGTSGTDGGVSLLLNQPPFPCQIAPGQDPETCRQAVTDIHVSFSSPLGRGAGLMTWTTTHEFDLAGFNLVEIDRYGNRVQQNGVPVPCEECVTGLGGIYSFPVTKHRNGRDLFVEMVRANGVVLTFGPATRE